MKWINNKYGIDIDICENDVNIIVFERKELLSSFIEELLEQQRIEEGENIISDDNGKKIKLAKDIKIIVNVFELVVNDRTIQKKLYDEISSIVNEKYMDDTYKLQREIYVYLDKIIKDVPYEIIYDIDETIIPLLKAYNVSVQIEGENITEKLINYIKVLSRLCGIKTVVFINLKNFLAKEHIRYIYQSALYEKMNLILIENIYENEERLEYEKYCIVDKDRCIISVD